MHVFIQVNNDNRTQLPYIFLRDGFLPCVDKHYGDELDLPPMEPAIWCKALVLEAVLIDCNQRTFRWSTKTNHGDSDWQWMDEEISEYDDDGELFDLARAVVDKIANSQLAEATNQDPELDADTIYWILRMFHCFILPKVSFNASHLDKVRQAMENQGQKVEALREILKEEMIRNVEQCEQEFRDAQKQFLSTMQLNIDNGTLQFTRKLLESLLLLLEEDLEELNPKLHDAGNHVRSAKDKVNKDSSHSEYLEKARQNRNSLSQNKMPIVMAMAEIGNELKENTNLPKKTSEYTDVFGQYYLYIEKRAVLHKKKIDSYKKEEQKRCALMIQETLRQTINDLHKEGFSQIDDADSQGIRPTDVLHNGVQPEWQTLSEKVATAVKNTNHIHEEFCDDIGKKCQEILLESTRNVTPSSSVKSFHGFPVRFRRIRKSNKEKKLASSLMERGYHGSASYESLPSDNQDDNPYQESLENLKQSIFDHFERITASLSNEFLQSGDKEMYRCKLRIAYESCFYENQSISGLFRVYHVAHQDEHDHLLTNLGRLKRLPVSFFQLSMNDSWLEMFDQRPSSREPLFFQAEEESTNDSSSHIEEDSRAAGGSRSDTASVRSIVIETINDQEQETDSSLQSLLDEWNALALPIKKSFKRKLSISFSEMTLSNTITESLPNQASIEDKEKEEAASLGHDANTKGDSTNEDSEYKLDMHFMPALQSIKDMLKAVSPFEKLKKLVKCLKETAFNMRILRIIDGKSESSACATADDLLTLLVLMLLQLEPKQAASMCPHLAMVEDLMPLFLTRGEYGFALTQFQMALKVLSKLCSDF